MTRFWAWCLGREFVSWNQRIVVLKTDTPMALPAIKPLVAVKAKKPKHPKVQKIRRVV